MVEVFADVCCPFTHVGLRRFVEIREQLGRHDVGLVVRAWPLEIVNGEPLVASFVADEVAPDLFRRFVPEQFPSTSLPALAVAAAAYRRSAATGEAVSLELRDLLFEQGVDISTPAVLDEVARRHGIRVDERDRESVHSDLAEGRERGVVGSPHFFTSGGAFFCPSLEVTRDERGELRVNVDREGLGAFIRSCFG
jgi:predicted DsbA family dithiol-disulfide isomerase